VVPDVNAFPDHIFCDGASRSEIVVPLVRADGSLLGVWDVDSPSLARFDDDDRAGMEALCKEFMQAEELAEGRPLRGAGIQSSGGSLTSA